jgi:hypothetical protein
MKLFELHLGLRIVIAEIPDDQTSALNAQSPRDIPQLSLPLRDGQQILRRADLAIVLLIPAFSDARVHQYNGALGQRLTFEGPHEPELFECLQVLMIEIQDAAPSAIVAFHIEAVAVLVRRFAIDTNKGNAADFEGFHFFKTFYAI